MLQPDRAATNNPAKRAGEQERPLSDAEPLIHERIIISGFGGQGVLLAGRLLCVAGMNRNLYVSDIPSYGAEMRGGTARCLAVISSIPISSPLVAEPTILLALNRPSMLKFEAKLQPGGLLLYNSSLIEERPQRTDIETWGIPATELSRGLGSERAANIACIGLLLALRPQLAGIAEIDAALDSVISERNRKHNPTNKKVLRAGFDYRASPERSRIKAPAGNT